MTFRWRMGLDMIGSGSFLESPSGWWLDDVKLYTCGVEKMTFTTTADDGWVLESSELSSRGGTMNAGATTFILGDNAADKQYRSILSFNTAGLPDNAVITRVRFRVKRHSVTGTILFPPMVTSGWISPTLLSAAIIRSSLLTSRLLPARTRSLPLRIHLPKDGTRESWCLPLSLYLIKPESPSSDCGSTWMTTMIWALTI